MITTETHVRILAEAIFPKVVMTRDKAGVYSHCPGWHYMIAAGNRCRLFHDPGCPMGWTSTSEVLDGAHTGVRFESSEASFKDSGNR
jgi:hypothetical protein